MDLSAPLFRYIKRCHWPMLLEFPKASHAFIFKGLGFRDKISEPGTKRNISFETSGMLIAFARSRIHEEVSAQPQGSEDTRFTVRTLVLLKFTAAVPKDYD